MKPMYLNPYKVIDADNIESLYIEPLEVGEDQPYYALKAIVKTSNNGTGGIMTYDIIARMKNKYNVMNTLNDFCKMLTSDKYGIILINDKTNPTFSTDEIEENEKLMNAYFQSFKTDTVCERDACLITAWNKPNNI